MKPWKEKIRIVSDVVQRAQAVFQSGWHRESCWEWLEFLHDEMKRFDSMQAGADFQYAFFSAMVQKVNFEALERLAETLREITDELSLGKQSENLDISSLPKTMDSIVVASQALELKKAGADRILAEARLLREERQKAFIEKFLSLQKIYEDFAAEFYIIAACLLYHLPEHTPVRFRDFQDMPARMKDTTLKAGETWPSLLRFMAQGFFSHDGELRDFAAHYLVVNPLDASTQKNFFTRTFLTLLLFVAFQDFDLLSSEFQEGIVELHLWNAMQEGVPVTAALKKYLAAQPYIDFYVHESGILAAMLRESRQPVFSTRDEISIGSFLTDYEKKYGSTDVEDANQKEYVILNIKAHGWSTESAPLLIDFLWLYVHLRECDLVDYHGMLSEDGVKKAPYDWVKLMKDGIPEKEIDTIKQQMYLLQRPMRLKVELIVAIQSVPWTKEPYLSRALLLNELYTDIYPEPNGPLIYFDAAHGEWKPRKELTPAWQKVVEIIKTGKLPS